MSDPIVANLFSIPILAFMLGFVAPLLRSDLRLPEIIYQTISLYLLFAIGIKGGVQLHGSHIPEVQYKIIGILLLGFVTALVAFLFVRFALKQTRAVSGAIAAHYGSCSAVTFIACSEFLKLKGLAIEGYFPALVALLEIPGIVAALILAQGGKNSGIKILESIARVVVGKSVLLLAGGFLIGWVSGPESYSSVEAFFSAPFKGVLTFFLLELGVLSSSRLKDFKQAGYKLIFAALVIPIINGVIGCLIAYAMGLGLAGQTILAVLAASGSYIAAPAAVKASVPEAPAHLGITLSLGVTFPLNLIFGIPFFLHFAMWLNGVS